MDISSREHIETLINTFYEKVKRDDQIGFIFNDVMKVNWEQHLPVMYDFWETLLLNAGKYARDTMGLHFEVNRQVNLKQEHFTRWLALFSETVDELFQGEIATMATQRAKSIAGIMQFKMNQVNMKN